VLAGSSKAPLAPHPVGFSRARPAGRGYGEDGRLLGLVGTRTPSDFDAWAREFGLLDVIGATMATITTKPRRSATLSCTGWQGALTSALRGVRTMRPIRSRSRADHTAWETPRPLGCRVLRERIADVGPARCSPARGSQPLRLGGGDGGDACRPPPAVVLNRLARHLDYTPTPADPYSSTTDSFHDRVACRCVARPGADDLAATARR